MCIDIYQNSTFLFPYGPALGAINSWEILEKTLSQKWSGQSLVLNTFKNMCHNRKIYILHPFILTQSELLCNGWWAKDFLLYLCRADRDVPKTYQKDLQLQLQPILIQYLDNFQHKIMCYFLLAIP